MLNASAQGRFLSFEASRRLSDVWYLEAEVRWFSDVDEEEITYDLRQDDYFQLEIKRYF